MDKPIDDARQIIEEFIQCAEIGRPNGKLIAQARDWLALTAAQQQGQAVAGCCRNAGTFACTCNTFQPMQQGGGEVRIPSAAEWCDENAAEATMEWRAGWDACRVEYPRTAPPSAPVGVEDIAVELEEFANCPGRVLTLAGKLRALAQQPAAANELRIDRALAERVMDALGRFTSDEGWSAADMMTADAFGAALATQHQEPTT